MSRRIWAIARLTFWEGIRMRIVLVFVLVLVFIVLRLPFALRGDETLAGRLQTFLSYSLAASGVLLSLATVFLSCSTLASEIRSRVIHLVVTKPVTRFEILAGKWLGVNLLMVLLLGLCGAAIYGLGTFIKNQPEQFERDRVKLRDVVWTARAAASPTPPEAEVRQQAQAYVEQLVQNGTITLNGRSAAYQERYNDLMNRWRSVPPGYDQMYRFDNLVPPRDPDEAIQVRFKARGTPLPVNEQVRIGWWFADPQTGQPLGAPFESRERSGDLHQFLVRARAIHQGQAALVVINPPDPENRTTIHFEGDDSLQVLYKVASFESNFGKTLLILWLRLMFLSALGLFCSTFVSFPVACFCALTALLICVGMPWWLESIGANLEMVTPDVDPYGRFGQMVRFVTVPLLKLCFPNFAEYDGATRLIDGEYVPLELLVRSLGHMAGMGAVLVLLVGWLIFRRREIAEVTV